MDEARDIPTNVEALTQLCIEQRVTLQANRFEIEHLRLQVARLRGLKFEQSSERFVTDVDQLALGLPADGNESVRRGPAPESIATDPEKRKPVREALPEYLPREDVVHPAPCQCPDCGGKLRKIGTVVTEVLEIVPTHLKVHRHMRDKLSCGACDTVVAPAPPVLTATWAPVSSPTLLAPNFVTTCPSIAWRNCWGDWGIRSIDRCSLNGLAPGTS